MAEAADPFESTRMSLGEHLEELRRRLFIGMGAVAVALLGTWFFRDQAVEVVLEPYTRYMGMLEEYRIEQVTAMLAEDAELNRGDYFYADDDGAERLLEFRDMRMQALAPGEGFFFILKICLYFAIFVGSPVLLWQMWRFVSAGLYDKERRAAMRYFPASLFLFVSGVLFGYFLLVPYGMYFLSKTTPLDLVQPNYRVQDYFSFVSSLCLALGGVFQLPILMTFLARLGVVGWRTMARFRGHMLVGAVVLGAMITPPDPYTQLMMAVPIAVLYEVGIWCARLSTKEKEPQPGVPA